jgi:two-component system OmpR family response regulator
VSGEGGTTILVVEDEPSLRTVLDRSLTYAGFTVKTAGGLKEAHQQVADGGVHLALLDIMLPDGSGLDLATELRAGSPDLPVIFLTAKDLIDDLLTGFALGGDDYITKPFSIAEVIARIHALLRRTARPAQAQDVLTVEGLQLREAEHEVTRDGESVDLSPTEYRLLHFLMTNSHRVLSKEQILDHVWGYGEGDTGVVEKFISQLRRKIDEGRTPLVHTVRGFGYVLKPPKT